MLKFLVFFVLVVIVCAHVSDNDSAKVENVQSWVLDNGYSLYPVLPIAAPSSQDRTCRDESRNLIDSLKNRTLWAMQMWDSSAKTPTGVLSGNLYQLGNFDECLRIKQPIKAQYCLAQIKLDLSLIDFEDEHNPFVVEPEPTETAWRKLKDSVIDPSKIRRDVVNWGLCIPSSCTGEDMEKAINDHLVGVRSIHNETLYSVEVNDNFCTKTEDEEDFTIGEICFWIFTSILIVLTVTGTALDFFQDRIEGTKLRHFMSIFSAKENAIRIFESEGSDKDKSLTILHGLKFVSIVFVVLGHRIGIFLGISAVNYHQVEELLRTEHNMFFVQTDLVVDTFFFISGLLVCYISTQVYTKNFVNPVLAILVRISRLAPAYFFILWFQTSAVMRLGSGPLWNVIAKSENDACVKNWWTNVLFINNYVNSKEICMPHSWYIPCDLHFFVLSIPIVMILVKKRKLGLFVLTFLIIVATIVPGIITYVNKLQPLVVFYHDFLAQPRSDNSFIDLYIPSHNRATAYLIGMMTGYFLYSVKDSEKRISKFWTLCGCTFWLGLLFVPMAYGSLYYDVERPYNIIEASIFASFRRLFWALGFSVFIILHRFGVIPILGRAFSSKIAIGLSNVTYGVYLIHFNLMMSHIAKIRTSNSFILYDAIVAGFGDLIYSILLATILLLTLELPLKRIFRDFILDKKIKELSKKPDEEYSSTITFSNATLPTHYVIPPDVKPGKL